MLIKDDDWPKYRAINLHYMLNFIYDIILRKV